MVEAAQVKKKERKKEIRKGLKREFKSLAFGATIFEPKLDVFWLKFREFQSIRLSIEFLGVAQDERMGRVGIERKPVLKTGHLCHRIDECSITFTSIIASTWRKT